MKFILILVILATFASCANAGTHKCTGPDGKVTFSDVVCPTTSANQDIKEHENTIDTSALRQYQTRSAANATGPDSEACTQARQAMANATQTKIDIRSERMDVQAMCGSSNGSSGANQSQNRAGSPKCAEARQAYANAVNTKLDVRSEKSDVQVMCGLDSPTKTTMRCRDIGLGISHCR